jgi:hypothetical protein
MAEHKSVDILLAHATTLAGPPDIKLRSDAKETLLVGNGSCQDLEHLLFERARPIRSKPRGRHSQIAKLNISWDRSG